MTNGNGPVTRGSFADLTRITSPVAIPPPQRLWTVGDILAAADGGIFNYGPLPFYGAGHPYTVTATG